MKGKYGILGVILLVVLSLDRVTKVWAESALLGQPSEILGGLMPLTLAYNTGAAFGMSLGGDSRWFFIPVTFVALGLLIVLFRQAEDDDRLRHFALAFIMAGALGNLYDRIFIEQGVVDFLGPVDLGFWHFPIFNVADISITCGAILLALSFWQEEKEERARLAAEGTAATGSETPDGGSGPADAENAGASAGR